MIVETEQPCVTCLCNEPEGAILREIRQMVLTPENVYKFWEKSRHHPTLFSAEIRNNFEKFLQLFLRDGPDGAVSQGLFWVMDDMVGLFYMTDIQLMVDCQVHYTFFDGRHHGRVDITREMLRYGFSTFGFRRMTTTVPLYAYPALKFAEQVGFKQEGRKRAAALYKNKWFDVRYFGILKEEANRNGRIT